MQVRMAGPDDADVIAEVHVASWQAAYASLLPRPLADGPDVGKRSETWSGILAAPGGGDVVHALVGDDDRIIGFSHCCPSRDVDASPQTGEVASVYVRPDAWRHGGGRLLLDAATASLAQAGFLEATLWVLCDNERARSFYERIGWSASTTTRDEERGPHVLREIRYRRALT